jgi:hypothetical protein
MTSQDETENSSLKMKTFRFLFSEEMKEQLEEFSKKHMYTKDKHEYKEAWEAWVQEPEIKNQVKVEMERLAKSGFVGDTMDSMYKSARYYYGKKYRKEERKEQEEKPTRKRSTISFSGNFLSDIDEHIMEIIQEHTNEEKISTVSPAKSFTDFCNKRKDSILKEIQENEVNNSNELVEKLKKTYKNRYYNIRVALRHY